MKEVVKPFDSNDGFDWTENFDGYQSFANVDVYYNLKFVVGQGGAQTRSLREVYHFIRAQQQFLASSNANLFFINVLDGDGCFKYRKHFAIEHPRIFVGDSASFEAWFKTQPLSLKPMKQCRGQFYTKNATYIFQGMQVPMDAHVVEPFAGEGDLLDLLTSQSFEGFDIEPKRDEIQQRDTLLDPPSFEGSFILTNPPFLARNKAQDKTIFDRYKVNDLYKCFLLEVVRQKPKGGMIILPLNFWSSLRTMDVQLRRDFLQTFRIVRVNVFETRVFSDTSYTVCSLYFECGSATSIPFYFFPSETKMLADVSEQNMWTIGGEIYMLPTHPEYHVDRLIKGMTPTTNIVVKCIDDAESIGARWSDVLYVDETKNKSARSYLTLAIEPVLSEEQQRHLIDSFNQFLQVNRAKYHSLFLTNYRESQRKRISFDLVYRIIAYLLCK